MKRIKLSIAGLLLSGMSYGQCSMLVETKECCKKTITAVYEHEGMVMSDQCKDSITFSKYDIVEMISTLEDILEWQQEDMNDGDTNMGSHDEGWGSNYWLTEMKVYLQTKYDN